MVQNEQVPNIDNTFICMPRSVGYSLAMQQFRAFKLFMESITKEENNDEGRTSSNA